MTAGMPLGDAVDFLRSEPVACACAGGPMCCIRVYEQATALHRGAHITARLLSDLLFGRLVQEAEAGYDLEGLIPRHASLSRNPANSGHSGCHDRDMGLTSDPTDPRLTHGADPADGGPVPQADMYLVLTDEERRRGFVRPVRRSYWHTACGAVTTMALPLAETFAANPHFYGATYCSTCRQHRPVGANGEFFWCDLDSTEQRAPASQVRVGT